MRSGKSWRSHTGRREERHREEDKDSVKVSGFCTTSIHFSISNIKVENIILLFPFCPVSIKGFKVKAKSLSSDILVEKNLNPQFHEYSLNFSNGE